MKHAVTLPSLSIEKKRRRTVANITKCGAPLCDFPVAAGEGIRDDGKESVLIWL